MMVAKANRTASNAPFTLLVWFQRRRGFRHNRDFGPGLNLRASVVPVAVQIFR